MGLDFPILAYLVLSFSFQCATVYAHKLEMASRRKQKGDDFKQEDVLQAVVIADSFNVRFAPITKNKPRVLLPLANIPLLEYTLEFLCSSGIQEVIIFCCAHANQIKAYLAQSKWDQESSPMEIYIEVSEDCLSTGDALRELDAKSLISNDFVLVNGDMVSNVQLKPIIEAHKARRLKDKSVLMTMLFKKAPPGHSIRCKEDDIVMAVRPASSQILTYQKLGNMKKFDFPLNIFTDNKHVSVRYDLQDTNISICSPHVPPLFTDNFDFLTRDDFVRGILVDEEILGHTIHIHELEEEYAARVSNLHMYDAISQDVLNRWVYPLVPDNVVTDRTCDKYSYGRHNVYQHQDVILGRDCKLQQNVLIGKGSTVGEHTSISNSVIGQNCKIGKHVRLDGAYIWDNVTVADHCEVRSCILDHSVQLLENVNVRPGCVLATNVVVGPNITLNAGTLLTAELPDDALGDVSLAGESSTELVGSGGHGQEYRVTMDSDEEEVEEEIRDVWGVPTESNNEDTDSILSEASTDGTASPPPDESKLFYNEVISTLERARDENIGKDNLVLEINSVKYAYGIQIKELNQLLSKAIMALPLQDGDNLEPAQYFSQIKMNFQKFLLPLLRNYLRNDESQMDCIVALEEFSINNSVCQRSLVNILHFLYEEDIFAEEVLLKWHTTLDLSAECADIRKQIRQTVNPFIKWLKEAEEESDDDDDDEEDDDDS